MKKIIFVLVIIAFMLLTACGGGNVDNVEIPDWKPSDLYSDGDIEAAFQTVKDYFAEEFDGCTLTKLYYPGDTFVDDFDDIAKQYGAEEAIVICSSFDVDSSGGDGSLNPNSTYEGWKWFLIRNEGENWKHADHGY